MEGKMFNVVLVIGYLYLGIATIQFINLWSCV